jgi:hypothetical protein
VTTGLAETDTALAGYQAQVLEMRRSPYIDYPAHVHMETLSRCNARCTFCPYPGLERKGHRMPDALIEKILDDLRGIPRILPFQFSPFKVNEPFLDTRLFDVLAAIEATLPQATITLTTNASPLTEAMLDKLSRVKNLGYLWVSLNDHRPAAYEATMGLPWARTLERLTMLHARCRAGALAGRVVLSRVGDGSAADGEFVDWVVRRYPGFEPSVFRRGGWLGQVETTAGIVPDVGCTRWFDLSITSTGTVAHCCMDGQAAWPIGDVATQHALEIYNAPHYRRLRERALTRLEASPCRTCTFL